MIQKLEGGTLTLIVAFPLQYHPYFLEILQSYILSTLLQSSSNAVSVQSSSNAVSVIQKLGGESNAAHMSVDFLRMLNAVHMCISVKFLSAPHM